jgi:hypothetical protein
VIYEAGVYVCLTLTSILNTGVRVRFEAFTAVTMKNAVFRDVALVITDVSEKLITSIIRMERIIELGALAETSNCSTLRRNIDDGGDNFLPNVGSY